MIQFNLSSIRYFCVQFLFQAILFTCFFHLDLQLNLSLHQPGKLVSYHWGSVLLTLWSIQDFPNVRKMRWDRIRSKQLFRGFLWRNHFSTALESLIGNKVLPLNIKYFDLWTIVWLIYLGTSVMKISLKLIYKIWSSLAKFAY